MLTILLMRTSDVLKVYGGAAAVARILGIKSQAVSQWPEEVPELRQYKLREVDPQIDIKIAAVRKVGKRRNHQSVA